VSVKPPNTPTRHVDPKTWTVKIDAEINAILSAPVEAEEEECCGSCGAPIEGFHGPCGYTTDTEEG